MRTRVRPSRPQTAAKWKGSLLACLKDFDFQPVLTPRLDALTSRPFTQGVVDQIVLWKVNRYVDLNLDALEALNSVSSTKQGRHRDARPVLATLMRQKGIDLAMASTLLRFRNKSAFQIIDRRAFRAVFGKKYPLRPHSSENKKIELYFDYLDRLFALADSKKIDFAILDRVLYVFDKRVNGTL